MVTYTFGYLSLNGINSSQEYLDFIKLIKNRE